MSESNKKERAMSVKGWLRKAETSKLSASAFLAAHRSFLETGELAELVSPILRMHDDEKQELLSTKSDTEGPADKYLHLIKDAVFSHHMQAEVSKAERRVAEQDANPSGSIPKNWLGTVYDSKGNVALTDDGKEITASFALASDADRWADRKLFDNASDCFAVIEHTKIMRADGTPISTVVMRDDAISRLLKVKKQPFSKKTGSRDGKLSWGAKVQQSHAHFSRG
jgi:hypothetical protein